MKYIVIIGDGMADYPLKELGGRTPLETASTPGMDFIAREGRGGMVKTIPDNMSPGSDVANLSLMGYNPEKYYTGRGPLEAASIGAVLEDKEVAFRCNLVNVEDGNLEDFNAGHISTEEAHMLIDALNNNRAFRDEGRFYRGVSYRHLFITVNGNGLESTPPHDAVGSKIKDILLRPGDDREAKRLNSLILNSRKFLEGHEVNRKRIKERKPPANMIWLWGQGKRPKLKSFEGAYGLRGAVISAVDLIKGIGAYAGMKIINVPGATGYYDTDYKAKAKYALKAIGKRDYVYVHIEAPDEAGHAGDIKEKIKAIERIDNEIVKRVLDNIDKDTVIAVLPDHPTPIGVKTHTREPVPFSIYYRGAESDGVKAYSERELTGGVYGTIKGQDFTSMLKGVKKWR